jgi:3-hydroxyisobutyrate dehydrogenase-like beta-hydroxyacid dehydrogenase
VCGSGTGCDITRLASEGRPGLGLFGPAEDFERVLPVLQVFGDVHHAGAAGAGGAMKLVVNTTLTASIVALGEALALGHALGLDQRSMLDVLADSSVGPTVRAKRAKRAKRANVETGRYPPSFKLSLAAKAQP